MEIEKEKEALRLKASYELYEIICDQGKKYQLQGMDAEEYLVTALSQTLSLIMQIGISPEGLTNLLNIFLLDGIDGTEEPERSKLKKFQRITAFCEPDKLT